MHDIGTVSLTPGQNAERNGKPVGKDRRLGESLRWQGLIDHLTRVYEHLVTPVATVECLGSGLVLIGIHRIFQSGLGPHAPTLVKVYRDEFTNALAFLGNQLDLVTLRQRETLQLLSGCEWLPMLRIAGLDLFGCLSLFFSRFFGWRGCIPGRGPGCWRQLADSDVFHLHHDLASTVNLRGNDAIERNVGILLGVITHLHPVDPNLDARALGEDAVLVPPVGIHLGGELTGIERFGEDQAAPVFIVDLAKPTLAAVHLVALDRARGIILQPLAADLNAAVDEPRLRVTRALDLEAQVKVRISFLGGNEAVARKLLLVGASRDGPVLHPPYLGIVIPALEGLTVKKRHLLTRLGLRLSHGEKQQCADAGQGQAATGVAGVSGHP